LPRRDAFDPRLRPHAPDLWPHTRGGRFNRPRRDAAPRAGVGARARRGDNLDELRRLEGDSRNRVEGPASEHEEAEDEENQSGDARGRDERAPGGAALLILRRSGVDCGGHDFSYRKATTAARATVSVRRGVPRGRARGPRADALGRLRRLVSLAAAAGQRVRSPPDGGTGALCLNARACAKIIFGPAASTESGCPRAWRGGRRA
jgi:hypothetical protein